MASGGSGTNKFGGVRQSGAEASEASSASKKKLKDRANQESREAKRAAAVATGGGATGDNKKEVFVDWKQSSNQVIVRLRCGEGVQRVEDVNVTFTDTHCHAKFPDGREWECRLQEEIEGSCSRLQFKEKGSFLLLTMQKKIPNHTWPYLQSNRKEKEPVTTGIKNGKEPTLAMAKPETTPPTQEPVESVKPSPSPRPPASPTPAEPRRGAKGERAAKRAMKNKVSGVDRVAGGPEGDSSTGKAAGGEGGAKGNQQALEPHAKRQAVPPAPAPSSNSSREPGLAVPPTPPSSNSTPPRRNTPPPKASNGKATPAPSPAGRAATGRPKAGVQRADRQGNGQHTPGSNTQVEQKKVQSSASELPSRTTESSLPAPADTSPPELIPPEPAPNAAPSVTQHLQPDDTLNGNSVLEDRSDRAQSRVQKKPQEGEVDRATVTQTGPGSTQAGSTTTPGATKEVQLQSDGVEEVEGEEKTDRPKEEPQEQGEDPEPQVNLQFVKNDSYEKGTDLMVVNVYLKGVCRDSARVIFREQDFTLIFQTSDANFLRLHADCGPTTVFKWQVKLRNLIQPEQCSYAFTPSRLDITLKKRHSQRWGGLEAPATQVGGAKVAVPSSPASLEKSQPGGSQHSLPAQEEAPRVGEDKPKAPLSSSSSDDDGLGTVGPRSVSEHVGITKQEASITSPKPTCMVQPMTHTPPSVGERHEEEEEVKKVCLPGFTGLVNLGNTCFMNSVIQSLSNTRELRDFFHDRAFETEINCSNPLGTGGRLAIGFAVLLRALWKGTHHAFQPSKLKAIVASKASQFTGYAQHDAQEFMAFLLDGLHEDLNRIQNKPYTETVDSDGRLDELHMVAEEAWQRHKMRNDSFIVDLFQGQYKSKLVCPVCSKVSITFDPFLYLPVPLPQKQKVLTVFFFAREPHRKPVKFLVSVSKENSSTADVLETVSRNARIKPENLRLTEVVKSRFHRVFLPSQSLDTVSPSDMLLCFELLSKELAKERVVVLRVQQRPQVPSISTSKCAACLKPPLSEEEKLKRCTRCYRVGYCNQVCQRSHWSSHKGMCRPNMENVGLPFLVSVPQSRLTYGRLTQLLEGYSRFSVDVFQPPFQSGRSSPEATQSRAADPGEEEEEEAEEEEAPVVAAPVAAPVVAGCGGSGDTQSSLPPRPQTETPRQAAAGEPDTLLLSSSRSSLSTTRTSDSGFSELLSSSSSSSSEPQAEKETSCEKAVRPEAAVPGYQHPSETASGLASQFYVSVLDSNNKEQKLEEKDDAVLELSEDSTLELVWKNNERHKEYVLVRSKELEYQEDPGSISETARAGHFTLEQCLNLFTKPEVLAPEEAWYCPKCQQHREASKQLLLWRLPNVLIIQLKRFSFRSFIWRDKINDMVDFPVRNLDLSKFCIGQKEEPQQPPVYDLYAVINHYGGMIGGHYTAYARLPSDKNSQRSDVGWRLFDDSTVTTVEESQVVTRYAYVLFYRRRNSPVERPPRFLGPLGAESSSAAGAAASQASLIWQELEEEEEGPRGLLRFGLPRRRRQQQHQARLASLRREVEGDDEEERVRRPRRRQRVSDYPHDDCVRYVALGTVGALFALFLNLFYPLIFRTNWG